MSLLVLRMHWYHMLQVTVSASMSEFGPAAAGTSTLEMEQKKVICLSCLLAFTCVIE